jgi:hypothetical protein
MSDTAPEAIYLSEDDAAKLTEPRNAENVLYVRADQRQAYAARVLEELAYRQRYILGPVSEAIKNECLLRGIADRIRKGEI